MHHPVHPSPVVADSLQIRALANVRLSCWHTLREAEQKYFVKCIICSVVMFCRNTTGVVIINFF